jgi:hypothetical protein
MLSASWLVHQRPMLPVGQRREGVRVVQLDEWPAA